jgi:5-deoxy-5-amino-3-dehydroquinate synthase
MNLPPDADATQLIELMAHDKKAVNGLTFVLDGPAWVEQVTGVTEGDVEAALKEIAS